MNRPPVKSWAGKQHLRTQIQEVARKIRDTDRAVRAQYASSIATGLICQGMRDPSLATDPLVAQASQAQCELSDLHTECVQVHNLDWDLVYDEWIAILENKKS